MNTSQRFEIKQELLPTRCEVCHQADLFDPKTGICQRCQGTLPARLVIGSPPRLSPLPPLPAALARLEYASLAPGQTSRLTYRDVMAVWTEAVRLYLQHFRVLCGLPALIETLRFFAIFAVGRIFHPHHRPFDLVYMLFALFIFLVPLSEIARGAVVWAVHDSLPDQSPQCRYAFQKATAREWGSVWTTWKSNFSNLFLFFGVLILGGATSALYRALILKPTLTIVLTVFTILIGSSLAITLFHGLHLPIAFLEGTRFLNTSQRSQSLVATNLLWLTSIEFFRRSGYLFVGYTFQLAFFPGLTRLRDIETHLEFAGYFICSLFFPSVTWMNIACFFPLLFGLLLILKLVLSPVLTIAQTLFYMLLRARAEAPRGIEQPLSDTILS